MTITTKLTRKSLQNLWNHGKDLESDCDRVGIWLEDSGPSHIKAVMVIEHILTGTFWRVDTVMEAPLFEAFGFRSSDRDDSFTVTRVEKVDWCDTSYEVLHTLSEIPPRLPLGVLKFK